MNLQMLNKSIILILGKLPPPYYGPAIATQIILNSSLNNHFDIKHLATNLNEQVEGIESFRLRKIFASIQFYAQLVKIVRRAHPEIVLVPISQSTIGFVKDSAFILISKWLRKKVIIHLRGSNFGNWLDQSNSMVRCYVKYMLKKSVGVIVLGENLKYLFKNYFPPDRIFVVPNGADYPFEPAYEKEHVEIRILFLSNLLSSKGIEDFLSALQLLQNDGRLFCADIVGTWCEDLTKINCHRMIQNNKLCIKFHPPAYNERKINFFLNSDIFVFTPRMPEGHPWVIIEAMAAGLPIISTDQGAITESVIDGVNGFIVETHNPQQIAEKIKFLLENPDIRIQMGRESRRLYLEKFTEDKMVENLTRVFNTVLAIEP